MRLLLYTIIFMFIKTFSYSSELDQFNLGKFYIEKEQYYNAITEFLRYESLYPEGKLKADILYLKGYAYYKGDNLQEALNNFYRSFRENKKTRAGEKALLAIGNMQLLKNNFYQAQDYYHKYFEVYPKGLLLKDAHYGLIVSSGLLKQYDQSLIMIDNFKKKYKDLDDQKNSLILQQLILNEKNRPKKSLKTAFCGSLLFPGFGHFYAGKYKLGALSLLTNAALIGLIVHGVKRKNKPQIIFFSLVELTFYQYSLIGGLHSVKEYNESKIEKQLEIFIESRF